MLVDYSLYCKNLLKYTFWLKTNEKINFINLIYSFQLKRLELDDDPRILSAFYMIRYFFGRTARVLRVKRIFTFGKNYFDLDIAFIVHKNKIFFPLYFWIYEIQSCVNIKICRDYCLTNNYLTAVLWEVNIFSEKKTNPALFDLIDPLHFKLNFNKGLISNRFLLIKLLKFVC
jgi:hypothetical protein